MISTFGMRRVDDGTILPTISHGHDVRFSEITESLARLHGEMGKGGFTPETVQQRLEALGIEFRLGFPESDMDGCHDLVMGLIQGTHERETQAGGRVAWKFSQ